MIVATVSGERGRRAVGRGGPRRLGIGGGRASRSGGRGGHGSVGPASPSSVALDDCTHAFLLLRPERPGAWRRRAFRRWVDLIRSQLAPIQSLEGLAWSFAREAVHSPAGVESGTELARRLTASPLLVAYVLRWLEVRYQAELEPWRSIAG